MKHRIAYISTPVHFGGADKVNLAFLKQADRSRFEICPVCLVRPWEQENFFVRELEKDYAVCSVPVARRPRSEGRDPFRVVRCYQRVFGYLRAGSFDLVHTHGYFADIIAIPASRRLGIPHLSTCHGFIESDRRVGIYNTIDRFALRFADRIIAVSGGIANELMQKGIRASRIVTIPNAVNVNRPREQYLSDRREKRSAFGFSTEDFAVGYAGRMSEEKGVLHLVLACFRLRRAGIPVKLVLLGEGPQRPILQDLVKSERMEGAFFFAGFVADVEGMLPALDVFVLPSFTEGTPMALLEAMACGVPVIATSVGGVPQVVDHGRTGLLVPPGSPEAIAQSVQRLYRDEELRSTLADAARKEIRLKYDIRDWTRRIESEYLHVLEQGRT